MRKTATVSVSGKKEIVKAVNELTEALTGGRAIAGKLGIMWALGDAGEIVAAAAKSNARAVGAPSEVTEAIFTYRGLPPEHKAKRRPAALVGVGKQDSLRQWRAGRIPKSPRAKVAPGGAVAMSLAAMYEFGTSRRPATAFFSNALRANRAAVRAKIQDNLRQVIARAGK